MAYDSGAMSIVIGDNLDPRIEQKMRAQIAADILTSKDLAEREKADIEKQKMEQAAEERNEKLGIDDYSAPSDAQVSEIDNQSTEVKEQLNEDDNKAGDGADPDAGSTDDNQDGKDDQAAEPSDDNQKQEPEKDDLDEPNAAFEHAYASGKEEYGYYLKNGAKAYRERVRKNRLAVETLQMDAAHKESLIKRLLYVKPADSGFTSKLQTMISTIQDPGNWIALVDPEGIGTAEEELTKRKIQRALEQAGVQVFDNIDTLIDTVNDMQKTIRESGNL